MKKIPITEIQPNDVEEIYLKAIAEQTSVLPPKVQPGNVKELYLQYIAENGTGGGGGVTPSQKAILDDVVASRTNYKGEIFNTLEERLNKDYEVLSKGEAVDVITKTGDSPLTVKDTLDGEIKNLKIYGNTIGGYDEVTATSSPLQSVGNVESGLITVSTCGKNLIDFARKNITVSNGYFYEITSKQSLCSGVNYTVSYYDSVSNTSTEETTYGTIIIWFTDGSFQEVYKVQEGVPRGFIVQDKKILRISLRALRKSTSHTTTGDFKMQIEESTDGISTEYEPYQESLVAYKLPLEMKSLKGISPNVYDVIDEVNPKIKENCIDYTFTGNEDITMGENISDNTKPYFVVKVDGDFDDDLGTDIKSSHFNRGNGYSDISEKIIGILSNQVRMRDDVFYKTRDIGGFRNFLKTNTVSFVVKKKTPIIHELPNLGKLHTFKSITTTTVETEVTAKIEGDYPILITQAINRLENENKTLRTKNTVQDEKIIQSMLGSTEIFEMIVGTGVRIASNTNGESMAKIYATLVLEGIKTIEDIPMIIRQDVVDLLGTPIK